MSRAAGISRNPYLFAVAPRVCMCTLPPRELGRFRKIERALTDARGYWNVYLAFFGEQQIWLDWYVTDLRDGRIIWRNGRHLTEGASNGASYTLH
jgi:hypothetical protein